MIVTAKQGKLVSNKSRISIQGKDVERLNHFEVVGEKVGKAQEIIQNCDITLLGINTKKKK